MEILPDVNLINLTIGGIGLPVLLVFFTQAIKGLVPDKYRSLIPILIGVGFSFLLLGISPYTFLAGIGLGIIANGEYKMVK